MTRGIPRTVRPLLLALALALPVAGAAGQGSGCAPCDSTQRAALARTLRARLGEVEAELARLRPAMERLSAEVDAGEPMNDARLALIVRQNELRGIEAQLSRDLALLERQQRRLSVVRPRQEPRVRVEVQATEPPQAAGQGSATGYIGVSFSGAIEPRPGARSFYFHDYPQIVAVDAGSPAERGGLQAGDVLVMLGDAKLKGTSVDLDVVLRPGAKVPVRFRRDGSIRQATLVVARPPTSRRSGHGTAVLIPLPDVREIAPVPAAPPAPGAPEMAAAAAVMAPLPPIFGSSGMTGAVGGAEVSAVQGNLREILGVDGGLLVLDVGINSPAGRAGLRAGDVIQRADGHAVRTPGDLLRVVRDAGQPSVRLEVVRKKQRRVVVLRW